MKRISKGFSKTELIIMLATIAVLFAIGSKVVLDSTSNNYSSFKTVANNFANAVSLYKDKYPNGNNKYFLKDVVAKGFSTGLKNPLDGPKYCDEATSYVELPDDGGKIVHLYCGEYYIEGVQNQKYTVYRFTEWSEEKKPEYNDADVLYNYTKDGKVVLTEYVESTEFINRFYTNEGQKISNPFTINQFSGYKLLTKEVYRAKTLLKEI